MRVELRNLDEKTFWRACAQLDDAEIAYDADVGTLLHDGDTASCRRFVMVALHDPDAKAWRR